MTHTSGCHDGDWHASAWIEGGGIIASGYGTTEEEAVAAAYEALRHQAEAELRRLEERARVIREGLSC